MTSNTLYITLIEDGIELKFIDLVIYIYKKYFAIKVLGNVEILRAKRMLWHIDILHDLLELLRVLQGVRLKQLHLHVRLMVPDRRRQWPKEGVVRTEKLQVIIHGFRRLVLTLP